MADGQRRSQISEKAQNQRLISNSQPQLGLLIRFSGSFLTSCRIQRQSSMAKVLRVVTFPPLKPSGEVLLCKLFKLVYSGTFKIVFAVVD
jgi:hypothetical protein